MKNKEYRSLVGIKTRSETENSEDLIISGYFILFNEETELWDGYFERISPKALDKTINNDIRVLINHDTSKVLARSTNDTVKFTIDDKGLFGEVHVNKNDTEAVNLYERVKRGDVNQCSFGFIINDEKIDKRDDGTYHSTILDIELFEVSVVTYPAYANTSVNARKDNFEKDKKREHEVWKKELIERINKNA